MRPTRQKTGSKRQYVVSRISGSVSQEISAAYDITVATLIGDIYRDLLMNCYGYCLKINKDVE